MTDVDTVELEPCPRCGAEPGHQSDGKSYVRYVCSKDCTTAHGNPENQEVWDKAAQAWNTRTIAALPPAVPQDAAFKAGQFAAMDAMAKQCWHDGLPPKPYGEEWFIAKLDDGSKVVLRELHENHSYDYTTRDETYLSAFRVVKWMQFPDSGFVPCHSPAVPATTPDPVEAHVDGWRVRVIEWGTDETVKVVQCKGEREAKKIERGMGINMASEYYTEIDNKPRTTTTTTTPDPVSEAAKVTSNDLYYLRTVMRRMNEFHEALADEAAFSLGGQALADECDWLTDFIYRQECALTKDGEAG